ncbi:hypothetical protein MSA_13590 [Streptococcus agalactiae ILRI005]|nr:hypothetical protein MSA_13590 [Streptococcus agalactiae ILRI005]
MTFSVCLIIQISKQYNYILDDLKNAGNGYYPLHSSMILEFDNVVVMLQGNFARKKKYCKIYRKL